METTDQDLLRASARDPEAFGRFYDRHFDSVVAYFYRRTSCPHLSADLAAETFAKALLGCHRFRSSDGTATAWLYGIARHELHALWRRERVSERAMQKLGIPRIQADDHGLERIEAMIDASAQMPALRDALDALPVSLSEAVELRIGLNLPFEEVAKRLDCSLGAARVRVSRGLTKLAEVVGA